jgi:hypothetical protein
MGFIWILLIAAVLFLGGDISELLAIFTPAA